MEYDELMIIRNKITPHYSSIGNAELEYEFEKYKLDKEIQMNELYSKIDYLKGNINTYKDKASSSLDKYHFINLQLERLKEKISNLDEINKKINEEKTQKDLEIKILKEELNKTQNKLEGILKGYDNEKEMEVKAKLEESSLLKTQDEQAKKAAKKRKKKKKKNEQTKIEEGVFIKENNSELNPHGYSQEKLYKLFNDIELEVKEEIENVNLDLLPLLKIIQKFRETLFKICTMIGNFKSNLVMPKNLYQYEDFQSDINMDKSQKTDNRDLNYDELASNYQTLNLNKNSIYNKESKIKLSTDNNVKEENLEFGVIYMKNGNILVGLLRNVEMLSGVGLVYFSCESLYGKEYYMGEFQNMSCQGIGQKVNINGERFTGLFLSGQNIKMKNRIERKGMKNNKIPKSEGKVNLSIHTHKTIFENEADKIFIESHSYFESLDKKFTESVKEKDEAKLYKFTKLKFLNGDIYEGALKDNKYHGKGKYYKQSGSIYDEEWKNGKMEGLGKYLFRDGDYYLGEYKEGLMNGRGKYVWIGKKYYEGEFKYGKREGFGKEEYIDKSYYLGNWKDNQENGK